MLRALWPCVQEIERGAGGGERLIQLSYCTRKEAPITDKDRPSPSLESATLVELLMQHVPAYLFVKDAQFRIVAANTQFLGLYPESIRDTVLGTTTVEKYNDEQRAEFLEQDRLALEVGFTETTETIDFPNGDRRTLLTRKVGHTNQAGERYVLGIATDVTDLQRSQSEAAELGRIVEASLNEVYVWDAETLLCLRANQGALKNLGYSLEEIRSKAATDLFASLSPEEFERCLEPLRSGGEGSCVLESKHQRSDGSEYHVELHLQLGSLEGRSVLVGVALDTTELVAQRHKLASKNEELTEFAYRTSHDLRAPVVSAVAILGLATELIEAGQTEQALDVIQRARASLRQVLALTDEITQLTRLDNVERERTSVSVSALIDAALEKLNTLPGFTAVTITREERFEGDLHTDVERLRGILENLISNAVKYRDPERDSTVKLTTRLNEEGKFVFECADNGLGVPADYKERLFSMFSRFHPKLADGTGLGLYMVRRSAERLGGGVEHVDLEPGSLFRVTLAANRGGSA